MDCQLITKIQKKWQVRKYHMEITMDLVREAVQFLVEKPAGSTILASNYKEPVAFFPGLLQQGELCLSTRMSNTKGETQS